MTVVLGAVTRFLFEPRPGPRPREADAAAVAIAIIAAPGDAAVAAAAVGLGLAARRRAQAVVICSWSGGGDPGATWRAAATAPARRLAAQLRAAGHATEARGPLVLVALPQNEDEAMAQARSAGAAAGAAPVVIALGRPRGAVFERALADQDLVVIAGRRERADLAALAASRLPTPARTAVFELPAAVVPRLLAAGGFRLARPMKAMVEQALEGL